jgi:hypothetical protein
MATPQAAASFTQKQGKHALTLYRNLMKLQLRKIPEELRTLGDLYIKQEFRLHLDKANEDQMTKFLVGWTQYEQMLANQLDFSRSVKQMKEVLHNPALDELLNDKLTTDQQDALKDFKNVIYEAEKKKADS